MKKKIVSIIIVALTILFTGCVKNTGTYKPIENNNERFQIVYTQDLDKKYSVGILYDKESKIKYMCIYKRYGYGRDIEIIKLEE